MDSNIKMLTAISIGLVLVLGCVACAGCTSNNQENLSDSIVSWDSKNATASDVVGTWVEKISDDQYMVYNVKADGNAEMITYIISSGKQMNPVLTTWKNLGNHTYEIGDAHLIHDVNTNQWQMSHANSGVFVVSKYSSTITAPEHIVDAVSSVAKKVDMKSEKLEKSITTAIAYLNMEPYSRIGLIEVMQKQNIDNTIEAVDNANINWKRQAELAADKWTTRGENTVDRLTIKLSTLGFTDDEVQHGVVYAKEKGLLKTA